MNADSGTAPDGPAVCEPVAEDVEGRGIDLVILDMIQIDGTAWLVIFKDEREARRFAELNGFEVVTE